MLAEQSFRKFLAYMVFLPKQHENSKTFTTELLILQFRYLRSVAHSSVQCMNEFQCFLLIPKIFQKLQKVSREPKICPELEYFSKKTKFLRSNCLRRPLTIWHLSMNQFYAEIIYLLIFWTDKTLRKTLIFEENRQNFNLILKCTCFICH